MQLVAVLVPEEIVVVGCLVELLVRSVVVDMGSIVVVECVVVAQVCGLDSFLWGYRYRRRGSR